MYKDMSLTVGHWQTIPPPPLPNQCRSGRGAGTSRALPALLVARRWAARGSLSAAPWSRGAPLAAFSHVARVALRRGTEDSLSAS